MSVCFLVGLVLVSVNPVKKLQECQDVVKEELSPEGSDSTVMFDTSNIRGMGMVASFNVEIGGDHSALHFFSYFQ